MKRAASSLFFDSGSYDIRFESIAKKKFFYILLTPRIFSKCRLRPTSKGDKIGTTGSIEMKRVSSSLVFDSDSYDMRFVSKFKKKFLHPPDDPVFVWFYLKRR